MEKLWNIYGHYTKDTNILFYIGMGLEKRLNDKTNRNNFWHNMVNKHGYYVKKLYTNLTQEEAFNKEIELIKYYGRIDLGTGILVNMTDGGEGKIKYVFNEEQKEHIKKLHTELSGKKIYLYELYTDKVLKFDSKRETCRFLVKNGYCEQRKSLYDGLFIKGEYLVKHSKITQEEKVELMYNTPQIDMKVLKMSMDFNEVIEEYKSARDAVRKNNCTSIMGVLDKKKPLRKSSMGFRWVYKIDYVYKGLDYLKELYSHKRYFDESSLIKKKSSN